MPDTGQLVTAVNGLYLFHLTNVSGGADGAGLSLEWYEFEVE